MKEVSPQEANEILQKDPNYIYLDVRSIPEFEQGHPLRAMNIPLLHFAPGMGMSPNKDFTRVVADNIPKNAQLLVGCKSGGRSAQACETLSRFGYSNVTNVRAGFVGVMDQTGRIVEPGWSLLNLPVCTNCEENASYSKLSKKQ